MAGRHVVAKDIDAIARGEQEFPVIAEDLKVSVPLYALLQRSI
jgi:hypothetical protein